MYDTTYAELCQKKSDKKILDDLEGRAKIGKRKADLLNICSICRYSKTYYKLRFVSVMNEISAVFLSQST